jgi:uroporphyrinogen-III synthase
LTAVTCGSPSAARNVLAWCPWLVDRPFVAFGPTTAAELRALGVWNVRVATAPTAEALRDACRALADEAPSPETTKP